MFHVYCLKRFVHIKMSDSYNHLKFVSFAYRLFHSWCTNGRVNLCWHRGNIVGTNSELQIRYLFKSLLNLLISESKCLRLYLLLQESKCTNPEYTFVTLSQTPDRIQDGHTHHSWLCNIEWCSTTHKVFTIPNHNYLQHKYDSKEYYCNPEKCYGVAIQSILRLQ